MKEFEGRRILIVGGAGFVGSALVRRLLETGPQEILVVDNLLSAERENLPDHPALTFVQGSICDNAILATLPEDLDFVFHLATFHGNQNSIADPLADHENNTLTTLKLFERLKTIKHLKKVVYASAGCTVAEKTFEHVAATSEDAPISLYHDSPYQISKLIGEFYSNYYLRQHGLPVVKARFQNVYGPGEILGAGAWRGTLATIWRNVIPTFVYRALNRTPLIVDNEGLATRDFIYVEDIARGLMICAAHGRDGEVYNLASGVETSIANLARLINELSANPVAITWGPKRSWDRSGKRFGSTEKARTELGFEARMPLREGLSQTIAWTRENQAFIDRCIRKHDAHAAPLTP